MHDPNFRVLWSLRYRRAQGVRVSKNAVLALDATTGMQIWRWDEKDWDHIGAAGDEEHVAQRAAHLDRVDGITCLPDAGGIPLINTKDGTVYAASSHGGNLTLLKNKEPCSFWGQVLRGYRSS